MGQGSFFGNIGNGFASAWDSVFGGTNQNNSLPTPPPPPQIDAGGEVQGAALAQENKQGQASTNLQRDDEPGSTMAPSYSAGRTILGGK